MQSAEKIYLPKQPHLLNLRSIFNPQLSLYYLCNLRKNLHNPTAPSAPSSLEYHLKLNPIFDLNLGKVESNKYVTNVTNRVCTFILPLLEESNLIRKLNK